MLEALSTFTKQLLRITRKRACLFFREFRVALFELNRVILLYKKLFTTDNKYIYLPKYIHLIIICNLIKGLGIMCLHLTKKSCIYLKNWRLRRKKKAMLTAVQINRFPPTHYSKYMFLWPHCTLKVLIDFCPV